MPLPPDSIRAILRTQYFAVLNSFGKSQPYSSLVAFYAVPDLKSLVFATDRNTRKYRNLQENKNVSLLVDNRTNQPADLAKATAVTAIGQASEAGDNRRDLKEGFLVRHPRLADFVAAPDTIIMVIQVREYIVAGFSGAEMVTVDW